MKKIILTILAIISFSTSESTIVGASLDAVMKTAGKGNNATLNVYSIPNMYSPLLHN